MELAKVDHIVRRALAERGFPIHYYMQFLAYATGCVSQLTFDTLQSIKSVELTPTAYNTIELPCDYVDYVRVGHLNGQYFYKWTHSDDITREAKYEDGVRVAYPEPPVREVSGLDAQIGFQNIYTNEWGEDMGRRYNNGTGTPSNAFKVIRERNEIVLASTPDGKIILEYITDGLTTDSTTCVHPYAERTIIDWIFWQHAARTKAPDRNELRNEYFNSERILRGRLSELDTDSIIRELRSANHGVVKQ